MALSFNTLQIEYYIVKFSIDELVLSKCIGVLLFALKISIFRKVTLHSEKLKAVVALRFEIPEFKITT